jgi:PKHD-type hydroxylase
VRWVYPGDAQLNFLFNDLWAMALQANDDFFDFHLSKMGYLQVAEYKASEQGEYKAHQDVFYMNGDPKYHRKLSAIIQLSDPNSYDGGDFEVYGTQQPLPKEDCRAQGSVIFFPAFIQHAALPVTMGVRYSVASWIDGLHWR